MGEETCDLSSWISRMKASDSLEDAKQNFRRAAQHLHPDKGGDADDFRRLVDAYETCIDAIHARWSANKTEKIFVRNIPNESPSISTDDVECWIRRAERLLAEGRRTDARVAADEASKRCARNAEAHLQCARIRLKLFQDEESFKHAEKALELDPACSEAIAVVDQLEHRKGDKGVCQNICGKHKDTVMQLAAPVALPGSVTYAQSCVSPAWFASASLDATVCIWHAASFRLESVLREHTDKVTNVCWSPVDQDCLASGSLDRTARIWKRQDGAWRCVALMAGHQGRVTDLSFIVMDNENMEGSARLLTSSTDGTLRLWNVVSGAAEMVLQGHTALVPSMDVLFHQGIFASGSGDGTARIWDTSGLCRQIVKGMDGEGVNLVRFSPPGAGSMGGAVLVTCHVDPHREIANVLVWDVEGGQGWVDGKLVTPLKSFHGFQGKIRDIDMSANEEGEILLAIAASDGQIRVIDLQEGICLFELMGEHDVNTPYGINHTVYKVRFNNDATLLASAGVDNVIRVWDVDTGECMGTFAGHTAEVRSLFWLPKIKRLLSAGNDCTIRYWDMSTN